MNWFTKLRDKITGRLEQDRGTEAEHRAAVDRWNRSLERAHDALARSNAGMGADKPMTAGLPGSDRAQWRTHGPQANQGRPRGKNEGIEL